MDIPSFWGGSTTEGTKGVAKAGQTVGTMVGVRGMRGKLRNSKIDEIKVCIQGGRMKVGDGLQAVCYFKRPTSTRNTSKDVTV